MTSPGRAHDQSRPGRGGAPRRRPLRMRFGWVAVLLLLGGGGVASYLLAPEPRTPVSYTFFVTQVQAGNVADVVSTGDTIDGTLREKAAYPPAGGADGEQVDRFTTRRPSFADDNLFAQLQANGVAMNAGPADASRGQRLLAEFVPIVLLGGLLIWFLRRGATARLRRARRYAPETGPRTTFADVAGIEEAEREVTGIVDFLRDPGRYRRLGARFPRGVLLSGPPGTGKTLLARAVAGEAEVPLFAVSGSGVTGTTAGDSRSGVIGTTAGDSGSGLAGAGRARDLVAQALRVAPAVILIDDVDAAAGDRFLDEFLAEMDGLTGSEGVVVLAATNRPELLDPALLRPGRFDRRVVLGPPGTAGRRQILEVHTRDVAVDPQVRLGDVAAATAGMVGADLRDLVDEAALLAARRGHDTVGAADVTDALENVRHTVRGVVRTPERRRRAAVHAAGHALLGMLVAGADPVRTISAVPCGQAPDVPIPDPYGHSARHLRGRIIGMLGGRAAEEVVLGDPSTAAESDLDRAGTIARQMAGRWGMSAAIGPVAVLPPPGRESPPGDVAPATRDLVDAAVRGIVQDCHAEAVDLLRRHRERLDRLAGALLAADTLDEDTAYAAAGIDRQNTAGGDRPSTAGSDRPSTVGGDR